MLGLIWNRGRTAFQYDAIEDSTGKRKQRATRVKHEDAALSDRKRDRLTSSVQDVVRNFQIVSWMCRKHLDYVTTFSFKAKNDGNDQFNLELERFIDQKSDRHNFHVARRHSLRRFSRIAEGQRVLGGDFGILKHTGQSRRGKVQGIENDLIRNPDKTNRNEEDRWINGVKVSPATGETTSYGLHRRIVSGGTSSTEFNRIVPARNMYLHANYDATFRHDQVRGTSAFAAAYSTLQDSYEVLDYEKTRHKIARMFGLVIKTDDPEQTFERNDPTKTLPESNVSDGRFVLDLRQDDEAEFLENKTNVEETVTLLRYLMQMACLALDLPVSMLDERDTTFFGGRGALVQYIHGCNAKRADVRDFLNDWSRWRIGLGILDGELTMPSGMEFNDIQWDWRPCGIPWWDPVKEVSGYGQAVAACFTNFDAVIQEVYGGRSTVEENIRENAKAFALAEKLGFPITLPGGTSTATASENLPEAEETEPVEDEVEEDAEVPEDGDDSST